MKLHTVNTVLSLHLWGQAAFLDMLRISTGLPCLVAWPPTEICSSPRSACCHLWPDMEVHCITKSFTECQLRHLLCSFKRAGAQVLGMNHTWTKFLRVPWNIKASFWSPFWTTRNMDQYRLPVHTSTCRLKQERRDYTGGSRLKVVLCCAFNSCLAETCTHFKPTAINTRLFGQPPLTSICHPQSHSA